MKGCDLGLICIALQEVWRVGVGASCISVRLLYNFKIPEHHPPAYTTYIYIHKVLVNLKYTQIYTKMESWPIAITFWFLRHLPAPR